MFFIEGYQPYKNEYSPSSRKQSSRRYLSFFVMKCL